MLKKNLFSVALSIAVVLSAFIQGANAATIPTFPACANPQGQVKSNYDSGVHGVVGDGATYSGKDTVYSLSENTLTQCLCTDNGNGIQTNWWKAGSLSQDEINVLISEGWILIPDGSAWGLDSGPYLAKNSNYSCASSSTGSVGGASATSILATSTQTALSLASMGNIVFILSVFLAGIVLVVSGIAFSFKKKA